MVCILDTDELEILFPIGALFFKRNVAKADFHPARGAVCAETGVAHVAEVFVTRDGAGAEGDVSRWL